jgi:alpha-tubulin suppressor-like RCC1 family protein
LGYGNNFDIGDDELPSSVGFVIVGGAVAQIVAGLQHTCALLTSGNIRCWGRGGSGRLGYGNQNDIGDNELPSLAGNVNIGGPVIQITSAASGEHTCALLDNGEIRCWGNGADGRLGYGNINNVGDDETPASVGNVNVGGTVVQVVAGSSHTCVLLSDGNVRCWGKASTGQLGYGNTNTIGDDELPSSAGNISIF